MAVDLFEQVDCLDIALWIFVVVSKALPNSCEINLSRQLTFIFFCVYIVITELFLIDFN